MAPSVVVEDPKRLGQENQKQNGISGSKRDHSCPKLNRCKSAASYLDPSYTIVEQPIGTHRPIRVACMGAGYSGLIMAIKGFPDTSKSCGDSHHQWALTAEHFHPFNLAEKDCSSTTDKMSSAFSSSQISKYLSYLALPAEYDQFIHNPQSFPKTEEGLTVLFRGQITRFPYDNLSVHYSNNADAVVDIRPESIYAKLMGPEDAEAPSGRGGYCLECSLFFYHILLGLGFSAYTTGVRNRARVNGLPQGEYRGWTHIVTIVQLPSGQQYHVDVAFGGDGPTQPLRLVSGQPVQNLGAQEVQLVYGNISKQTRLEQKLWVYQCRNRPAREWNSFYAFAELEFFQDDFEVINRYTSWEARDRGNFWVVKFIRGGETEGLPLLDGESVSADHADAVSVVGKLMYVNGVVKLNMGERTRVVDSFQNEEEIFCGLKRWFGMTGDSIRL